MKHFKRDKKNKKIFEQFTIDDKISTFQLLSRYNSKMQNNLIEHRKNLHAFLHNHSIHHALVNIIKIILN